MVTHQEKSEANPGRAWPYLQIFLCMHSSLVMSYPLLLAKITLALRDLMMCPCVLEDRTFLTMVDLVVADPKSVGPGSRRGMWPMTLAWLQ